MTNFAIFVRPRARTSGKLRFFNENSHRQPINRDLSVIFQIKLYGNQDNQQSPEPAVLLCGHSRRTCQAPALMAINCVAVSQRAIESTTPTAWICVSLLYLFDLDRFVRLSARQHAPTPRGS